MTLYADPNLERQILLEVFPYDEDAGATEAVYLASRDVFFPATDAQAPNREYEGRLISAFSLKRSMHRDGVIGGPSLPSYGAVRVVVDDAFIADGRFARWRRFGWTGRRLRVLMGMAGAPYADHVVLLEGLVGATPTSRGTEIQIPIADMQERLSQEIATGTYGGTGGFDGGSDLKGKTKPVVIGAVAGMEPVPVDGPGLWWDVSPTTGMHSYTLVTDGAAVLTPSASNPPPAGSYFADLANGRIRTGSRPVKVLRVDGRSAFAADALTVADLILAILTSWLGFTEGELDIGSFDALNEVAPASVGWVLTQATAAVEVIDEFINAAGGFYTGNRGGKLTVGRLSPPTATGPTHPAVKLVIDDTDLEKNSLALTPVDRPPWRIEIGCRRNWTVLSTDQMAGAATDADRAFAAEEYRIEAAERPQTKTKHPLSKPLRRNTALSETAAGQAEALRLRDLIAVDREMAECRVQTQPLLLELGDEVWVQSALLGIDLGFRLIEDDQSARDGRVAMLLWR